jgi:hypothetical protein
MLRSEINDAILLFAEGCLDGVVIVDFTWSFPDR